MENNDSGISVLYLDRIGTLIIKKSAESNFFVASDNSIVISKTALLILLKYFIASGIIDPKTFDGLLEELNTE